MILFNIKTATNRRNIRRTDASELQEATLPSIFSGIITRSKSQPQRPAAKRAKRSGYSGRSRIFTKDIVCLPPSDDEIISVPRGNVREQLAARGLIGKVFLNTIWDAAQIEEEISSVFQSVFKMTSGILPYVYLR